MNEDGDIKYISTKEWAKSTGQYTVKLFTKLLKDDTKYLLTMDTLCQEEETNASDQQHEPQLGLKDQKVLYVKRKACLLSKSIETLRVHQQKRGMELS